MQGLLRFVYDGLCLVYSLQDNDIETKNIGGGPHANYDLGPVLALDRPECRGTILEITHKEKLKQVST